MVATMPVVRISSTKSAEFQKHILLQKIKRHLISKYGNIELLDYIDLNALIDPTLSYSENLKNIEQYINEKMSEITKMQIYDFEERASRVKINLDSNEIVYFDKHGRVSEIVNIATSYYQVFQYVQNKITKYIPRKTRIIKKMLFSKFRTPQLLSQLNMLYNNEIE